MRARGGSTDRESRAYPREDPVSASFVHMASYSALTFTQYLPHGRMTGAQLQSDGSAPRCTLEQQTGVRATEHMAVRGLGMWGGGWAAGCMAYDGYLKRATSITRTMSRPSQYAPTGEKCPVPVCTHSAQITVANVRVGVCDQDKPSAWLPPKAHEAPHPIRASDSVADHCGRDVPHCLCE